MRVMLLLLLLQVLDVHVAVAACIMACMGPAVLTFRAGAIRHAGRVAHIRTLMHRRLPITWTSISRPSLASLQASAACARPISLGCRREARSFVRLAGLAHSQQAGGTTNMRI